jgi:hypothetical protein
MYKSVYGYSQLQLKLKLKNHIYVFKSTRYNFFRLRRHRYILCYAILTDVRLSEIP